MFINIKENVGSEFLVLKQGLCVVLTEMKLTM